jgi:hypothetical protein
MTFFMLTYFHFICVLTPYSIVQLWLPHSVSIFLRQELNFPCSHDSKIKNEPMLIFFYQTLRNTDPKPGPEPGFKNEKNTLKNVRNFSPPSVLKSVKNVSSLGRYVFGSEISYNKPPPRLPGLGC